MADAPSHDRNRGPTGEGSVAARYLRLLPARLARAAQRSPVLAQTANDLAMLWRAASPEPPPVARRFGKPRDAMLSLRVRSVTRETHDTVSIAFERPEGLRWEAGQFLTFFLEDGLRRSYSISGDLAVTVKRVEGGVGSARMHELAPGVVVHARGPLGSFTHRPAKRFVLVAGGSGITPVVAVLEAALADPSTERVHLLYACRSPRDVIFQGRLAALARDPRLETTLFLEEGAAALARPGRLDRGSLLAALHSVGDARSRGASAEAEVYLCGPQPMMDQARAWLAEVGASRVHQERFGSPRASTAAKLGEGRPHRLEVLGKTLVVAPGETLLEASARARVGLDSSCTMGGCGACRMRLVSGEVTMEEPNCLTADERDSGLVLTCVARPLTDVTLVPLGGSR